MKKEKLLNMGGIVVFYSVIIIGILLLNVRFSYINNNLPDNPHLTMNN